MKHKNDENIEKPKSKIFLKIFIILIFLAGIMFSLKIAPNYIRNDITDKTNLIINYSNVTGRMKQNLLIDENDVIYLSLNDIMNYYDKHIYYDQKYNQIVTSSETKLAVLKIDEKQITVNGEEHKIKSTAKLKDDIYYLPISEMEDVYNIKVSKIENKVVIESLDKKLTTGKATKKISVKYKPTFFSRTIEKVSKNEKVIIAEVDKNTLPRGWVKVRTQNGNIGYVEEKLLSNISVEREEKTYSLKNNEKISLAWEYFSEYAKAPDNSGVTYNGVNVVSPSFFYLKLQDTKKENVSKLDVISQANVLENVGEQGIQYINWAKSNGYKIWPKVSNDTLSTTIDEFSCIINDYQLRDIMIKDILNYVKEYNLDGINLDFEYMYQNDKDAFSKFVIELAPQLRNLGASLSVDVTAPDGSANWSLCYNRNLIGEVADYVVFMGYDQYGTTKIGTTSGYNWVDLSLNKFLNQEEVPAEKIILGLPFYTKLWKTKNGEVVNSTVIMIKNINNIIPENATKEWKEELQQYYIQYEKDGYVYKMWIEDEKSFTKKLDLVQKYNLAGAAYWRKGFENEKIWNTIKNNLGL